MRATTELTAAPASPAETRHDLRDRLEDLYLDYADLLDELRLQEWLDLFTEDCAYQVMSKENADRGLPLATMRCDSRAMLADRVYAIENTSMYAPRVLRHILGRVRVASADADVDRAGVECGANFLVVQTIGQGASELFAAGRYHDVVVRCDDGRLRFARKIAVYDSPLVPNSLIYPL